MSKGLIEPETTGAPILYAFFKDSAVKSSSRLISLKCTLASLQNMMRTTWKKKTFRRFPSVFFFSVGASLCFRTAHDVNTTQTRNMNARMLDICTMKCKFSSWDYRQRTKQYYRPLEATVLFFFLFAFFFGCSEVEQPTCLSGLVHITQSRVSSQI